MFILFLNLTHQHLNVAVGSELAGWDCVLEILPSSPCGSEAELWKLWKDTQGPSSPLGSIVGSSL